MKTKSLGSTKLQVSEMGLNCATHSIANHEHDAHNAICTLHHALDIGINFFDTADIQHLSLHEALLEKAFKQEWNKIIIATQFGTIPHHDNHHMHINGNPDYVIQACDASLKRLNINVIDLYYFQGKDQHVPIEETIGAMADLIGEGKIRYIGLSGVDAETLERAHKIYPITAYQGDYSLCAKEPELKLIPLCEKLHISFIARSPLANGLLAQQTQHRLPIEKNNPPLSTLHDIANKKTCSPAQLALAWLLLKYKHIIPLLGSKQAVNLDENVEATHIHLDEDEIKILNDVFSKPEGKTHVLS
jgi:aryl-alcohol dehydrogenase-like predicted oxidoreductase